MISTAEFRLTLVDGFLGAVKHVVVLDHLSNETTAQGGTASSGRHVCRVRRHADQQRRACATIFPRVRANKGTCGRAGDGWAIRHGRRWMICLRPWRRRFRNWLPP